MLDTILITLSPLITSALTGWVKGLPMFSNLSDAARTPVIRLLAAGISLAQALLTLWITGNADAGALDVAVNAFVLSLLSWLGSLGIFHAFFQKKD